MNIQLSMPDITQKEIDAVTEVMESGVLSIGPKVEEFERRIADYIDVRHAVAVNSGTSGLHLLVKASGIKDGDEVITTPFSFVASSNCILYERAMPVFADIDEKTMNIDICKLEEKITSRTKAVLVVDVFGHPLDIKRIREITDWYGLTLIEDSCEAMGSEYEGIKSGSAADGAVFAFYPNKQITAAEGGVIVTNSDEVARLCRSLRSQGRSTSGLWLEHEHAGYNYRLSELHSAVGAVQMERLDQIIEKRAMIAKLYNSKLKYIQGITLPYIDPKVTRMSWFVYVIRLDEHIDRNSVLQFLLDSGIGCRPYFTPIHLQKYFVEMFKYKRGDFPVTEKVADSTIALPFYNQLKEEQIDYITDRLREAIKRAIKVCSASR